MGPCPRLIALLALMVLACVGATGAEAATFAESDRWPVQHPVNSFSSTEEALRTGLGALTFR